MKDSQILNQSIENEVEDFEFEYETNDVEFLNDDDVEFLIEEDDTEFIIEDDIEFSEDKNSVKEQSEIFKKLREQRKGNNTGELHNREC